MGAPRIERGTFRLHNFSLLLSQLSYAPLLIGTFFFIQIHLDDLAIIHEYETRTRTYYSIGLRVGKFSTYCYFT